jgi:hypothetical protein
MDALPTTRVRYLKDLFLLCYCSISDCITTSKCGCFCSYVLRMKEFEREKRLKARDLRKKAKAEAEGGDIADGHH